MKQSFFVNIQNQVNHNNEKNILNYTKMEVLCIRSTLLNNDNNISVTVYKMPRLTLHQVLLYLLVNYCS